MLWIYKYASLACLIIFYVTISVVFFKKRKARIERPKKIVDTKNISTRAVDVTARVFSVLIPILECITIWREPVWKVMTLVIGLYLCLIADAINIGALVFAPKKNVVYLYSRNPGVLATFFLYAGVCLMYPDMLLFTVTIVGIVALHIKTVIHERDMEDKGNLEYEEYSKKVHRYFGRGKLCYDSVILYIYFVLFAWGVLYTFTCIAYAGAVSFLWIWPLLSIWSAFRINIQRDRLEGRNSIKIPKAVRTGYRILAVVLLAVFAYGETLIISGMNEPVQKDLDYVIVLGAGVNGTVPMRPLQMRIDRAYEYMKDNPDTILIASGGRGFGEKISEAQCIKENLVKMGIDEERILLEERSTSTIENMRYSKALIEGGEPSVGIISNSFHLYRAKKTANMEGINNCYGIPGITLYPMGIHYVVREFFGCVRMLFL